MWWRDLPPTGNPISLRGSAPEQLHFPGYRTVFVNSGTAALALALMVARARNPTIQEPEVILPGYACPDLVAAAVYAGVRPVLADIGASDPGYDLTSLQSVLNDRVVAVVAVNFLGIRERLPQLQDCLRSYPHALLIEDNAQWFPEPLPGAELSGAAVCLSFGRGKPISLLGGGAMLLHESLDIGLLHDDWVAPAVSPGRLYLPKVLAYNALLAPNLYGLVSRNPWLKLGRTVFKPLQSICALDTTRHALLCANVQAYLQRSRELEQRLQSIIPRALDFSAALGSRRGRLLRYPVLCESGAQRQFLLDRLHAAGLGATALYQRVLPDIEGVAGRVAQQSEMKGATDFAARLLTLPLHEGVTANDLRKLENIFVEVVT